MSVDKYQGSVFCCKLDTVKVLYLYFFGNCLANLTKTTRDSL